MTRPSLLLVANYDSDVGYAWWLMEGFWAVLAEESVSLGERVILAYPRVRGIPPAILSAPLTIVEQEILGRGVGAMVREALFIRRNRVKAIYFTDRPAVSWRYVCLKLLGVRTIIVHDHTPGSRLTPSGFRALLKHVLARLPLAPASGLIGASAFVSQRHRDVNRFPADRCFTASNGLPNRPRAEAANLHAEFGIPSGARVIVSVGRASPVKEIATVIRAVSLLVDTGDFANAHYLHLGDGPQLEELRSLAAQLGVGDRVTLAGRRDNVREILRSCAIAIHPSRAEVGYSLAILEFMEAALPLVVSDEESVRGATVDGETGLLFQTGEPQSAAAALRRLLADSALRARLGAAAFAAQKEHFTLERTHQLLLSAVAAIRERDL